MPSVEVLKSKKVCRFEKVYYDEMMTGRYNSIDLFKFIMAFAVVAIHTHPLEDCTNRSMLAAYDSVVSMAVPFFFLASGFLLARKMRWPYFDNRENAERLVRYLKRIIGMYLTWTVVYLPLALYHFKTSGNSPGGAAFLYLRGFLFIGEQYNSWHLWYLLSSIYALLVVYILLFTFKKSSTKALLLLSIIASVFSVGLSVLATCEGNMPFMLQRIRTLVSYTICNGRILTGMIYIPIGMILAHRKIPAAVNVPVLIIGYSASFFINSSVLSHYLLILTSIAFFGVIEEIRIRNNSVYPRLGRMSKTIYLTHMYIWTFYYTIVYGKPSYGIDCFLVTSVAAILICVLAEYVKNKKTLQSQ